MSTSGIRQDAFLQALSIRIAIVVQPTSLKISPAGGNRETQKMRPGRDQLRVSLLRG